MKLKKKKKGKGEEVEGSIQPWENLLKLFHGTGSFELEEGEKKKSDEFRAHRLLLLTLPTRGVRKSSLSFELSQSIFFF